MCVKILKFRMRKYTILDILVRTYVEIRVVKLEACM